MAAEKSKWTYADQGNYGCDTEQLLVSTGRMEADLTDHVAIPVSTVYKMRESMISFMLKPLALVSGPGVWKASYLEKPDLLCRR